MRELLLHSLIMGISILGMLMCYALQSAKSDLMQQDQWYDEPDEKDLFV